MENTDYLKEIKDTINAIVPKEGEITSIDLEGPEVAIYTKKPKVFHENEDYVKNIAFQLKKKVNIRADKSLLVDQKEAQETIMKIVPEDAQITEIQFSEPFSEVVIECLKPGLVIGKGGQTSKQIILETGWTPNILRAPTQPSDVLKGVRHHLNKYAAERKKILQQTANKIYSEKSSPSWIRLTPLGGFRQVGRSCILLETRKTKVLLDCGINIAAQSNEDAFPYLDAIRFPINELDAVILSHAHMDHCLPPESLVLTKTGYKKIDGIKVGEKVISMDWEKGKLVKTKCTQKTHTSGHEKILKIKTPYSNIESSPNHRFFTVKNLQIKELEALELKKGMLVPSNILNKKTGGNDFFLDTDVPYDKRKKAIITLPKKLIPELAEFIGYYLGDGHRSSKVSLRLTDSCIQILEHHKYIIEKLFNYSGIIRRHSDKSKNAFILEINNIKIIRFLEKNFPEIGFKTRSIVCPEKIMQAKQNIQSAFLRGFFDAEGTVVKSVKASTSSKKMQKDIQHLLSVHGIPVNIKEDDTVSIDTNFGMKKFCEKIGFSINYKREKLEKKISKTKNTSFEKQDLVPVTSQDFRKILKDAGMLGRIHKSPKLSEILPMGLLDFFRRKNGYITRKTAKKLLELLQTRIVEIEAMHEEKMINTRRLLSVARTEVINSTGLKMHQIQNLEEKNKFTSEIMIEYRRFLKAKKSTLIAITSENIKKLQSLVSMETTWEKITKIIEKQNPYPYLVDIETEMGNFVAGNIIVHNSGFIPYLFKLGYRGPVYCTAPTRDLTAILHFDYIDINAKENKDGPYQERDVKEMLKYCITREYREVTDIAPDMRLTFHNASHILGSASVHLHIGEGAHNLVYSSDIKYGFTRLFNNVDSNYPRIETLIVESTYGARDDIQTQREESEAQFLKIIQETISQGGSILIPSFAVGRAQEVQLIIENFYRRGLIDQDVKVYIDGMIKESSAIHTAYPEYLRNAVQKRVLQNDSPFTSDIFEVAQPDQRDEIVKNGKSIIIASSGMLTGGASVQYFYKMAEDPINTMIFVGYQGEGSLGRKVQSGLTSIPVTIENGRTKRLNINMRLENLDGFSGHSDRKQLQAYVRNLKPKPKRILTDHGEASKTIELAKYFSSKFGISSQSIRNLDSVRLR
ncbi:MAG: LAGLIDADG family homing endonuclease [Candidatus Diapherotrites archaeon]